MIKRLIFHYSPQQFSSRINYIVDFLDKHPLCPDGWVLVAVEEGGRGQGVRIDYGGMSSETKADYHIPAQQLIFSTEIPDCKRLSANAYHYDGFILYSVEKEVQKKAPFLNKQTFGFDIIESLFFHLSRFEEYHCSSTDWDEWEMMRSDLQFLPRHDLHHQAVVDQLVYCFFHALGAEASPLKTTFGMSHDIDVFRKYSSWYRLGRNSAAMWRAGRTWADQKRLLKNYRAVKRKEQKDPFDTFEWLLLDQQLQNKHIYFLSGGRTRYDWFYQIKESYVPATIQLAIERGYTIGLHPSYAAHNDPDLLQEEKKRLEQITGLSIQDSRQHFLHFDQQKTLTLLEDSGIKTDATFGYQDIIGFRCGTGFPYQLYNLSQERVSVISEIPMIVMDTALLMQLGNNAHSFREQLTSFIKTNEELTHITFNFHNSTFDPLRLDDQQIKAVYFYLIQTGFSS